MLRILIPILAFAILLLGLSSNLSGQATQPSDKSAPAQNAEEQAWPRTVESLAKALVAGDRASIGATLSSKCLVRRFGTSSPEDLQKPVELLAKSTVIGQHAYLHPPLVMAADIAADFKNAMGIPEADKVKFLIDDDTEMKRANATAVQWVVEQLNARQGIPVGVIILWTPRAVVPGSTAPPAFDVIFVLCRGEEIAPRQYKLDTLVYGSPLTEGN